MESTPTKGRNLRGGDLLTRTPKRDTDLRMEDKRPQQSQASKTINFTGERPISRPFVNSTTSVNLANALNRHLHSELDKESNENELSSPLKKPGSLWKNRFLRQDFPLEHESPSLIPVEVGGGEDERFLMNESAPGSILASKTRPSVRRTPAPPQPSSLRQEWVPKSPLPQTPSRLQSTLAFFGLSPKPSPKPTMMDSPRIRRSARLRYKTPRKGYTGEEETEIIYEYRGDTLDGRDLLPEFFGEHDIIQGTEWTVFIRETYSYIHVVEPGWVFLMLETMSNLWVFQALVFPLFSWILSLILIIGWGVYAALEFITIHFLAHPLGSIGQGLVTVTVKMIELAHDATGYLLFLVPARKRGIYLLSFAVVLSSFLVLHGLRPEILPGLLQKLTGSNEVSESSHVAGSNLLTGLSSIFASFWLPLKSQVDFNDIPDLLYSPEENLLFSKRLSRVESSLSSLIAKFKTLTQQQESRLESSKMDVLKEFQSGTRTMESKLNAFESRLDEFGMGTYKFEDDYRSTLVQMESKVKKLESDIGILSQLRDSTSSMSTDSLKAFMSRLESLESDFSKTKSAWDSKMTDTVAARLDEEGRLQISPAFESYLFEKLVSPSRLSEALKDRAMSKDQVETFVQSRLGSVVIKDDLSYLMTQFTKDQERLVEVAIQKSLSNRDYVTGSQLTHVIQSQIQRSLSSKNGTMVKSLSDLVFTAVSEHFQKSSGASQFDLGQRKDYALSSLGGGIVETLTSSTFSLPFRSSLLRLATQAFGLKRSNPNGPLTALDPSLKPGDCWAMTGSHGHLSLHLSQKIRPVALLVEHAPVNAIPSVSSAPKTLELWTLTSPPVLLVDALFDPSQGSSQIFRLSESQTLLEPLDSLELRILSNWGQTEYTCLYHVGILG